MSSDEQPALDRGRLLGLAVSAFVVLAAEPLYLLVDTAVVGHLGTTALAALGVASAAMGLAVLFGSFVEYGTTARGARWFGAGDRVAAVNEGVQASWLAILIGVLVLVVGELAATGLTFALGGGAHHRNVAVAATGWLRIAFIGLPAVLVVLAGNGWMRAVQSTRQPVRLVLLANGVSAASSPLLVYTAGLGLDGSALANVAGQYLAALLFLRALRRTGTPLRPRWSIMRAQLAMGRDLLLRSVAFQIAFLSAAAVAARFGAAQIAAHQIGLQLWNFTALLLDAVAIAAQSVVGAALGANETRQARQVASQVARWGLYAGTGVGACFAAGWYGVPRLFSSDPLVLAQTHSIWPWLVASMPAAGVVFALDGVLIGAGDVAFMRNLTLVAGVLFFAPLTLAAWQWHWGLRGVWTGLAAFIFVRLIGMLARTRSGRWLIVATVA